MIVKDPEMGAIMLDYLGGPFVTTMTRCRSQKVGHKSRDGKRRTNVTMEGWSDVATNQEILTASRNGKRQAMEFPLESSEGASSDTTLILFPYDSF